MNKLDYLTILYHMDLESEKEYVKACATGNDRFPRFVLDTHEGFVHKLMDTRTDPHLISYVDALTLIEEALRLKEL